MAQEYSRGPRGPRRREEPNPARRLAWSAVGGFAVGLLVDAYFLFVAPNHGLGKGQDMGDLVADMIVFPPAGAALGLGFGYLSLLG